MTTEAAIGHLVGLQAQAPRAPYVGLWSRLDGFAAAQVEELLLSRRAVRALVLLRTTIHLVTADDALAMRAALQGVADRGFRSGSPFGRTLGEIDLASLLAAGRAALEERPLTVAELAKELAGQWPDKDATALAMAVRYLLPLIQPTPRGLWAKNGPTTMVPTDVWLGRALVEPGPPDDLVLRYLAAFGPASVADITTWSWLTGVREVVDRLRPRLRSFRDEAGRELFDVLDAPLPDADTPAPPRFLPEYDNLYLSHKDRSRIGGPEAKLLDYTTGDGARVGPFLLDGFAAGLWRISLPSDRPILTITPIRAPTTADADALVAEAAALGRFIADGRAVEVRIAAASAG